MDGIAGFDWDEGNRAKCTKHGVSIAEIESLFDGDPALKADAEHSRPRRRPLRNWKVRLCCLHDSHAVKSTAGSSRERTLHAPERGSSL